MGNVEVFTVDNSRVHWYHYYSCLPSMSHVSRRHCDRRRFSTSTQHNPLHRNQNASEGVGEGASKLDPDASESTAHSLPNAFASHPIPPLLITFDPFDDNDDSCHNANYRKANFCNFDLPPL